MVVRTGRRWTLTTPRQRFICTLRIDLCDIRTHATESYEVTPSDRLDLEGAQACSAGEEALTP